MGLGFYGRPRTRREIDAIVASMTEAGDLDDPLLRFSSQLEMGTHGTMETLNLLPLFTSRAAVADACPPGMVSLRAKNAATVAALAPVTGWKPLLPDVPLRSGILLLEAERAAVRSIPPDILRTNLRDAGVAATVYEGGVVRSPSVDASARVDRR